ncbi:MAG TPA: ATP-binding protein [Gemmatimonadaceae bacterium]|nr:ATP-binding protein [Gemmatimonadaceae bacterium]
MNADPTDVLDTIPDGLLAFAPDWRVVLVNQTAAALMGLPRAELLGKALGVDLVYLDEIRLTVYHEVMRDRESRSIPGARLAGPGAGERVFEGHVYPATSGGIVVIFRDVTDRARTDAEARASYAALAGRLAECDAARSRMEVENSAKSQLLATLSHEMRTPLNSILGYAELLDMRLAGPVTDEQRTHLGRVRMSARHLLDLVNAVLDLGKIEAGELAPRREPAEASEAVQVALALVHPQIVSRGLTVIDRTAQQPPARYVGDVTRVRQILVNLLSNATKFAEVGGRVTVECATVASADVESQLEGAGPWARITVEDTGVGIPPEERERIFEPFVQLEPGHRHEAGGAGLGLPISRRLARLMGGDVTVRSHPGEGSVFTLWLPAAPLPQTPGAVE